jgi:hypothetical protein
MRANLRTGRWLRGLALVLALAGLSGSPARADQYDPSYKLELSNVTAKVGEHAVLTAKMRMQNGLRLLPSYNSRIIKLSALDESVKFDREVVRGRVEDDSLVFNIGLTPTRVGQHPINGLFRVGYARDTYTMRMVSIPLITTVTATE